MEKRYVPRALWALLNLQDTMSCTSTGICLRFFRTTCVVPASHFVAEISGFIHDTQSGNREESSLRIEVISHNTLVFRSAVWPIVPPFLADLSQPRERHLLVNREQSVIHRAIGTFPRK